MELMIVTIIVGILASIAYPSYVQYTVRSNRSAAQSHILAIASKEEQYLLDARAYTDVLTSAGLNMVAPFSVSKNYDVQVGTYADVVVADAIVKGIKGFDLDTARDALLKDVSYELFKIQSKCFIDRAINWSLIKH